MAHRLDAPSLGALHRLAADRSPDLLTVCDVDGTCLFASAEGAAAFGFEPTDLVGRHHTDRCHPQDVLLLAEAHAAVLAGTVASTTTVSRLRGPHGEERWVETRWSADGPPGDRLVVAACRDVTARRAFELELRERASTDPLTGAANRTVFRDRLAHALARLHRRSGFVAVLFVDLDRFKLVNDSSGHLVGDAVLVRAVDRMRRAVRPEDTLARLGGDEFSVLAEDVDGPEEALALGRRIVTLGREPMVIEGTAIACTTSVGVAVTSLHGHAPEALLHEADRALYRAKELGRDCAELYRST